PILPRIAEVGKHGRDPLGRCALERIDHQEQLDEIRVHRRARGLYDEDVGASDVFKDLKIDLAVAKPSDGGFAEFAIQILTNLVREGRVGGAAKNFQFIAHTRALWAR